MVTNHDPDQELLINVQPIRLLLPGYSYDLLGDYRWIALKLPENGLCMLCSPMLGDNGHYQTD